MNINLFYNFKPDESIPPGADDRWCNYKNPDTTKLYALTAHLWERNGFKVSRFTTQGTIGFHFCGQIKPWLLQYPVEFWNQWHAMVQKRIPPCYISSHEETWFAFATIDILNNNYRCLDLQVAIEKAEERKKCCVAISSQHYSHGVFACTFGYAARAISILEQYDGGLLPKLESQLVSDETILRSYARHLYHVETGMKYMFAEIGWKSSPLVHIPRSCLQHVDKQWPKI